MVFICVAPGTYAEVIHGFASRREPRTRRGRARASARPAAEILKGARDEYSATPGIRHAFYFNTSETIKRALRTEKWSSPENTRWRFFPSALIHFVGKLAVS